MRFHVVTLSRRFLKLPDGEVDSGKSVKVGFGDYRHGNLFPASMTGS
jgi:hypothetical protein